MSFAFSEMTQKISLGSDHRDEREPSVVLNEGSGDQKYERIAQAARPVLGVPIAADACESSVARS
jgi:hypothetical protein